MLKKSLLAVVVALLPTALRSTAGEADFHISAVEKLVAEIKAVLPAGWDVAFEPTELTRGRVRLQISITSAEELPVEHLYPGMPARLARQDLPREKVELWLAFMREFTPEQYATTKKRNDARIHQRRLFVERYLKGIRFYSKGEDPPAPFQFEPQTDAQMRLVQEYAFVWINTEPDPLPTHRYGPLSLWYAYETLEIHDAKKNKEYLAIVAAMEKLFEAY